MEPPKRVEVSPRLPEEKDVNQPFALKQTGPQSHHGGHCLDLDFQDSNLSPALSLLHANSGVQHNLTEYSLFQQSDSEFAPLRAYPDISMASDKFHFPPQDRTTQASDCGSLLQHPLSQATVLSEERSSSCFSLSSHSLPRVDQGPEEEMVHTTTTTTDRQEVPSREDAEVEDTFYLREDVPLPQDSTSTRVCKSDFHRRTVRREGPPGEASLSQQQQQTQQQRARLSDVFNVTVGSRSTLPDDSSEELHRELLAEVQSKNQPPGPHQTTQSEPPWPGPFSAGLQQALREQDVWSSGNQTGMDGSYLGFIPQSQSTPGVFKAPPKSSVKVPAGKLSAIESDEESADRSGTGGSPQLPVPELDLHRSDAANQCKEEPSSAEVQSLPSLNYLQKVDAWRTNQSSGKPALFDSLALQGFSGVSPKKKACDAVSDTLNQILSEQVKSLLRQPPNPVVAQSSTAAHSGSSSPRRGEAAGSAPSDRDNAAAGAPGSPCGRSQSHSSLSTVVMSVQKDKRKTEDAPLQPSPLVGLGQFSDVSVDSYTSGVKVATSAGASSVTSLEVDNYVPYWTSKQPATPPLPPELNIEERIPLYLHNLGIDQSPSTILTPFAPRGPIREPEFSPTDLCTIKGSIGTPTKSTQPSEGGSPHKGEFSRCSVPSVASSGSIPFSLDSLGPAASVPQRARRTSPPIDTESTLTSQQPEVDPSSMQQQKDSSLITTQNAVRPASSQQTGRSLEKSAEDSFGSSNAMNEIRRLLSRAEEVVSGGSAPAAPHPLSDDDSFLSLRKKSNALQDSSFSSSSAAEDTKPRSSLRWTGSSSDSMLASEKPSQSFAVAEIATSPWQPARPSTPSLITAPAVDSNLVLSQPARRAEPEGCSAAPPDGNLPTQTPVNAPRQLTPTETADVPPGEEEEEAGLRGPAQSRSSPSEDSDQGARSDRSSQSSLAARVAQLLQSESSATAVSSAASVTDQDEGRAREWIQLKISGQQCEPLELDKEDRIRIEEIKRELLLKYPTKSQLSTDTGSSTASIVAVQKDPDPPAPPAETLAASRDFEHQPSRPPPGAAANLADLCHPNALEAQVREIAAREGVALPRKAQQAPTFISIASFRRSTSPVPPSGQEPLHLKELSTSERAETNDRKDNTTRRSTPGGRQRREAAGGQCEGEGEEEPPPSSQGRQRQEVNMEPSHRGPEPTRTGHVSHAHLTLSPKSADDVAQTPPRDFAPLRASSSSSPEWQETRETRDTRRQWGTDAGESSSVAPESRFTSTAKQSFTPHHRQEVPTRAFASESPAVPVLLPYKPRGSEELFYVPQLEADVSSAGPSDTTMESSHTGSDDAVPPRFGSEVLGQQDPGLDRGVAIRHSEGIYSKRPKTDARTMQRPARRDQVSQTPKTSSHVSTLSSDDPESYGRDQGTSPLRPQPSREPFNYNRTRRSVPQKDTDVPQSLDQLWMRFCDRWTAEEAHPATDGGASLLERLELLSRLIHNTRGRQEVREEDRGTQRDVRERRTFHPRPAGEDGRGSAPSSLSSGSSQSLRLSPAHGDESGTASTTASGSMSTVDTARLVRVFGADRVQNLKSSRGLGKLYKTIDRQKEGREQRRGRHRDSAHNITPSESESSVAADSSTGTYALPSHRGPAVKLVSKGIQTAGDLEIVRNATRRHTRDVGTTFPSPHESRAARRVSSPLSKLHASQKQRRSRRSQSQAYPAGVSWFISADHLRSEARKENQEEEQEGWRRPSVGLFVPHSSTRPWREPLRQRQIHQDRDRDRRPNLVHQTEPDPELRPKTRSPSSLPHVTLQEALETRRPQFISRSTQRLKLLALQVEERKLQDAFTREREQLCHRPPGAGRLLWPAGPALLRRAVPRKEMIQRSKLIYDNLPEVQRRREEERRKAEYTSYRLNAQLYNKRITNRVLGKRTAWQ